MGVRFRLGRRGQLCDASRKVDRSLGREHHIAETRVHTACVRLLLQAGACLRPESLNDNPLISAIPNDHLECVKLLVEAGVDIHTTYELEDGRLHFYHVVPLYTQERDFEKANGMKPLLEAMAAKGLDSLVVRPDREHFV